MFTIVDKRKMSPEVFRMVFTAPYIARSRKPGQFIIIQQGGDYSERIPLTIADADAEKGTVTIIFQAVGAATHQLALLDPGEAIANVLGPLGQPTHIEKFGKVICVGGGIGAAPLHPIAQAMAQAGNELKVIVGARTKDLIIMEEEMNKISDDVIICTDDGSYGRKALVTEPLKELCEQWKPDMVVAIGPPIMMKFCTQTTKPFGVPIIVSLNTIMVDGTGMCGGCRVSINGKTKFVCVDGPEFDGYAVDWENMMMRLGTFKTQEQKAHHHCHIGLNIKEGEA
ncbi:MAG: sulfide/dihydroorotate dehydrogenase-like FAD/NAD-binding protein [Sphaerochaetaceae bacterium]|nr:sulfide/dihydroorotate dehydrogenase-like FAD/NAD-binding protein [Sphaerochaetaceae bacterium]NLO61237.1 sulfide/dihydroorotate dehydrogenase-like FAD/NAD-binding protein [Spirochaetales bacterium]MDD2406977.1 sulfide/dihydroorotate dehydrogenase-like FAD/NAD-binding protein [Sphaerochaetaceae bacterium]MDD3671316.1 sulfide/dihydroorotate dehydrogenase-like FAD/NAD-binding protein [Sphaerochaetaceae bacterium]MDD4260508.1 sulfide/dihydroorotate dehydrogenase-like FAD/NAD-binding protein [Sp